MSVPRGADGDQWDAERPGINLAEFGWFDEGRGEPVLLLHSSGASSRQWARLREPWIGRYRTLGLDLWGYGGTPLPADTERFTLARELDLVLALLGRVDQPVHVVGHSYGGAVALRLALDAPDLVRSVCVHEPVLFHLLRDQDCSHEWDEIRAISQSVLNHVHNDKLELAAMLFVDYWNGAGAWRTLSIPQQQRMATFAKKAPLDFSALFLESTTLSRFQQLAGKTLITVGESTRAPAAKVAELLGSVLGPEALKVLPNCGHMAPITNPEVLRPVIESHLSAH